MAIRSYCGVSPALGPGAWVDPAALVIGDVVLGADASIWPFVLPSLIAFARSYGYNTATVGKTGPAAFQDLSEVSAARGVLLVL